MVIARWLNHHTNILIFDEPTRGIDVGAKAEIYLLMRELTARGYSIIMISSELPEIVGMCDRVAVFRQGRIEAMLEGDAIDSNAVMTLCDCGIRGSNGMSSLILVSSSPKTATVEPRPAPGAPVRFTWAGLEALDAVLSVRRAAGGLHRDGVRERQLSLRRRTSRTSLRQVSINAIIAVGMTCVILTGGIDLSVGSVMALAGTLAAGLMVAGHERGGGAGGRHRGRARLRRRRTASSSRSPACRRSSSRSRPWASRAASR